MNSCNDFCLPHATFSIAFVLQGGRGRGEGGGLRGGEKPTKYDVNRNSLGS